MSEYDYDSNEPWHVVEQTRNESGDVVGQSRNPIELFITQGHAMSHIVKRAKPTVILLIHKYSTNRLSCIDEISEYLSNKGLHFTLVLETRTIKDKDDEDCRFSWSLYMENKHLSIGWSLILLDGVGDISVSKLKEYLA